MKLLIVEDDDLMQSTMKAVFKDAEITQATSVNEALSHLQRECFSAAFLDINLRKGTEGDGLDLLTKIRERDSYLPCIMISALEDRPTILKAFELGAVEYVVKGSGNADTYRLALHKALMWRKIFAESQSGRVPVSSGQSDSLQMIKGSSQATSNLRAEISKLGKLPGPFLILGETGTGKELVARALWGAYRNNQRPFVALNCASLPQNLVESELFGYERGAFTGALTTKTGLFEAASGGDIFLDEIGELTVELQAKLLRVLQEKRVRRLGSDKERPVDFRVIAATNQDLLAAVEAKEFRDDLFYRLSVHQILLPPLRERKEDIPELLEPKFKMDPDAEILLMEFSWPGNIRQLRAFCQSVHPHLDPKNPVLTSALFLNWQRMNQVRKPVKESGVDPVAEVRAALAEKRSIDLVGKLESWQKSFVEAALAQTENNRSQAAKLLGISRQRLSNWLSDWGS